MGQPIIESNTLLNANIGFLRTHLAIVHLPSSAYPLFLQPILSLLLHNKLRDEDGAVIPPHRPWNYWHPFVNVSITPNECSIVCPREEAEALFQPLLSSLSPALRKQVSISREDYSVITIDGEGLEAGQRVLDLTSPLALAGIPIFFITSYYSDFILVPYSTRSNVIHALEERGFVFEADSEDGEAGHMTNPASPLLNSHARQGSSSSSSDGSGFGSSSIPVAPHTPPPTTISDLQTRTFKILARNNVSPHVDPTIELITCAGLKDSTPGSSESNFTEGKLQIGIAKCLTAFPAPRFFSVTLTDTESLSLTLEKRLLTNFPNGGEDILLGTQAPEQIPITLDLQDLPLESTGIVCGVSRRLTEGMKGRMGREMFNMSYLSTSRAGHVIVYEDELEDAMEALSGGGAAAG
ncbi:Putative CASTOR, ACT domain-containing protein [Septoria linicola]|uniref:CASTOR, ACT domain-containing protein n=1 Tax=Septoria linicola TaxID=215465 RepID=A0A9Q9EJ37_9PEZI|nr:Putative CASTOR, ACT domain-containing protein [Septoria linicola]